MRRLAYSRVRASAARKCGLDVDNVATKDAATLLAGLNEGLKIGWERWWFPDWTPIEPRQFRADYAAATAYGAPTATVPVERYYPLTQGYYQTLKATTGNAPTNAAGVVDTSRWYPCAPSYSGNDWADATAYTAGSAAGAEPSIVRNPGDGRFYACITAHTSSGSFDATKFGILTPFRRDIDYEQTDASGVALEPIADVRTVWDSDPTVVSTACPIKFLLTDTGIIVRGGQPIVWLEYRKRRPDLTGSTYSATATYSVGQQIYFTASDGTADFWKCATATSAGESPTTAAAKWTRLEIPYVLADFLAQYALSYYLRGEEETERAVLEYRIAEKLLDDEVLKIERSQSQNRTLNVRTY